MKAHRFRRVRFQRSFRFSRSSFRQVIRDSQAEELTGCKIFINPQQLPEPEEGEYYWSDLIGLAVESLQGEPLGVIASMLETGADDVMVLKGDRERLIPFVLGQIVTEVDLANQRMVVDWLPEY